MTLFSDTYKTIDTETKGLFKAKGSRFIAHAIPVSSQEEIKRRLVELRKEYHDARHHCYAWVLSPDRQAWRVNDDGEPSGTAGKPILGQINSRELTNILVVVIRYFGGTLLGVSGLINAYRTAAAEALENATVSERHLTEYWLITFPYEAMNDVMKVLKEEGCGKSAHRYTGQEVSVEASFRASLSRHVTERLNKITGLRAEWIRTA
ncbi:MAG: YigZ family protein [Bacteroidales bacterium]|nr:YigZ family protein [Bacteroidales bacterium]MDT8372883.1 YigZ family protein [Bacteroidales bacterium]